MDKITRDIIESALLLGATIWFVYKLYRTKEIRYLFLTIATPLFLLWRWPLYMPGQISFGLIAILIGGFCVYENYFMGKKASPMAYFYILIFVATGLMLLGDGYFKMLKS